MLWRLTKRRVYTLSNFFNVFVERLAFGDIRYKCQIQWQFSLSGNGWTFPDKNELVEYYFRIIRWPDPDTIISQGNIILPDCLKSASSYPILWISICNIFSICVRPRQKQSRRPRSGPRWMRSSPSSAAGGCSGPPGCSGSGPPSGRCSGSAGLGLYRVSRYDEYVCILRYRAKNILALSRLSLYLCVWALKKESQSSSEIGGETELFRLFG